MSNTFLPSSGTKPAFVEYRPASQSSALVLAPFSCAGSEEPVGEACQSESTGLEAGYRLKEKNKKSKKEPPHKEPTL